MNFRRFEGLEREIQQSSAVAARRTCRPNPRVLATEGVGGRDVPAFVACPVRFALRPTRYFQRTMRKPSMFPRESRAL